MKLVLTLTAMAVISACALTSEQKHALADAAILQVRALNQSGFDPVSLSPEELAILSTACVLSPVAHPQYAADIADACRVVQEAAL